MINQAKSVSEIAPKICICRLCMLLSTHVHISFLCIEGAAIIARIPFRRHLLTPKGRTWEGGRGVAQIWVMWHIIRRISLMQIYGPGSGLTRVFSCLTFFFFSFFFFCTTLSCHVTENIIITIANCRTGEIERSKHLGGSHRVRMRAH